MKLIKRTLILGLGLLMISASCEKINDEPNYDNRLLGNWNLESTTDANGQELDSDMRLEFTSESHINGYRGVRMISSDMEMYCYYRQFSSGLELTENTFDNGSNARPYEFPTTTTLEIYDNGITEHYVKVP